MSTRKPVRFAGGTAHLMPHGDSAPAYALGSQGRVGVWLLEEDGAQRWQATLDACTEQPPGHFMGRPGHCWVAQPLLFVSTVAEHTRGATRHHPKLHAIRTDGAVLWSKAGAFRPSDVAHLLLEICGPDAMPSEVAAWQIRLHRIAPATGETLSTTEHTIAVPADRPERAVPGPLFLEQRKDGLFVTGRGSIRPLPGKRYWRRWSWAWAVPSP